ncbi:MFS transporter [Streptomyces iconiensis]|uniref:MFS transporter n=1 Tax=Streptomyces iconiensis TaxID=1384038 RepID=A0ABT7A6L0_9ACTN|nr:MFS transporter [Streptomyces iconiensis]MDJ1136941.1 MFS transporter [Streptomyces iconiensis]
MLLYPVYALLFTAHGLSPAEVSSLFVLWSVTTFALEIPSGVWSDLFSRRLLLVLAPLLGGTGFALWTFLPSYPAFACGFVLWGAGSALRSGTVQALVYEQLAARGESAAYARLAGRAQALGVTAALLADALAALVLPDGGYLAVGTASVGVCALTACVALTFPRTAPDATPDPDALPAEGVRGAEDQCGGMAVLLAGMRQVARGSGVARGVVVVSVVTGATALDEYVPFLAQSTGVGPGIVPLLVMLVTAGAAVGGWLAGRGERWAQRVLGGGVLALVAGALLIVWGSPEGTALVGAAFGAFSWTIAHTEARLQDRIEDGARATVLSLAGFGSEVVAVAVYGAYALGSGWAGPGPLFAAASCLFLPVVLALRRGAAPGWGGRGG